MATKEVRKLTLSLNVLRNVCEKWLGFKEVNQETCPKCLAPVWQNALAVPYSAYYHAEEASKGQTETRCNSQLYWVMDKFP